MFEVKQRVMRVAAARSSMVQYVAIGTLGDVVSRSVGYYRVRWANGDVFEYSDDCDGVIAAPTLNRQSQMAASAQVQPAVGQITVRDCKHGEELARLKGLLESACEENADLHRRIDEITGAKIRVGDVYGDLENARQRVAELEVDVAFWKREAIRAKGKR